MFPVQKSVPYKKLRGLENSLGRVRVSGGGGNTCVRDWKGRMGVGRPRMTDAPAVTEAAQRREKHPVCVMVQYTVAKYFWYA